MDGPGFQFRQRQDISVLPKMSRPALGPTPASSSLATGVKRPGREVNHSLQSSAEVKNNWSCTFIPPYDFTE